MSVKASGRDDASDAIVVSFESRWIEALSRQKVKVVFRKRGPKHTTPIWMYVYIGAPESSIIGRARIKHCEQQGIDAALRKCKDGHISESDLRQYAGRYSELFVFTIGPVELWRNPLNLATLRELRFTPPQSFLVLSKEGKKRLDKLAK